jgi:transcriptional regulator with PAS, ATPase and Fis domain
MLDYQIILNELSGGVVVVDQNQRISYVNDWIITFTNFPRVELENHKLTKIISGLQNHRPDSMEIQKRELMPASGLHLPVFISFRTISIQGSYYSILCILNAQAPFIENNNHSRLESPVRDHYFGLYGKCPKIQEMYEYIEMAAETDANVVIQGESGTGKELVASAIHHSSNRHDKPFIKFNCAALTETLLESELFGHVKGAFTGAYRDHEGKFEFAHKGTIFLDEIGEISPSMQAKLLRVLQERVINRVGDNREIPIDVRVIVATNRNLRSMVSKGKFREDLFYRLNVFPIHIPPLRERSTDIPLLIDHFIKKFRNRTGKHIESCSTDVMRILMAYCWPGNVRELENIIEHAFILSRTKEIQEIDLPHELRVSAIREGICAEKIAGVLQTIPTTPLHLKKESNRLSITREALEGELARNNGNKAATARTLGISKVALWKKMKKMGIE